MKLAAKIMRPGIRETGVLVFHSLWRPIRVPAGGICFSLMKNCLSCPCKIVKLARGKSSKAEANYRPGHGTDRCRNCTMFQPPHGCTSVKGKIDAAALCDFFKRKP